MVQPKKRIGCKPFIGRTQPMEVMKLMELVELVELVEPINAEEFMVWITWTLSMD